MSCVARILIQKNSDFLKGTTETMKTVVLFHYFVISALTEGKNQPSMHVRSSRGEFIY